MSKRGKIFLNVVIDILLGIAILCTVYFAFFSICFFTTHVEGESMMPTYNVREGEQDRILASKISGFTRGDIVIIKTSELDTKGNEKHIIKRVIALGGDSVDMKMNGEYLEVYVNGEKINEPQYPEPICYAIPPNALINFEGLKSNWQGEKNENGIVIPKGQVFVLGDNRENSLDSSIRGSYLSENVVAKVLCIVEENAFGPIELIKYIF